jgi:hypothetical protein
LFNRLIGEGPAGRRKSGFFVHAKAFLRQIAALVDRKKQGAGEKGTFDPSLIPLAKSQQSQDYRTTSLY